jgi:hypothetical protein
MTREEIERRMDELARKYVETHNPEIPEELHRLRRLLGELEKLEKQRGAKLQSGPSELCSGCWQKEQRT